MATIKRCDKCGTINVVTGLVKIYRQRKFLNQNDDEFTGYQDADYDVCEKCARDVELLFISAEQADKTILL